MNVLVVHPTPRPFIQLDIDLLRSAGSVRAVRIRFHPRRRFVADTLTALSHVAWADVVLAWFGGVHALIPFGAARLVGTRCAVIASGVDVAAMPSIAYGHMRPGWLRTAGRIVFRMAHRVFAVSAFTAGEAIRNAGVPPDTVQTIPHGLPPVTKQPSSPSPGSTVVTVATITPQTVRRKGIDTFIRAASHLPTCSFELIGGGDTATLHMLRRQAPANVSFSGWLPKPELVKRLRQASVYVQVSAHEAFGMALAEAMQCGCVPVVTRRGALPEVVGDTGWYVTYDDANGTARAIRQALAAPASASVAARRRIEERFPLRRRRDALINALRALVH